MPIVDGGRRNFEMVGAYRFEGLGHCGFLITADSVTPRANEIGVPLGIPVS